MERNNEENDENPPSNYRVRRKGQPTVYVSQQNNQTPVSSHQRKVSTNSAVSSQQVSEDESGGVVKKKSLVASNSNESGASGHQTPTTDELLQRLRGLWWMVDEKLKEGKERWIWNHSEILSYRLIKCNMTIIWLKFKESFWRGNRS